MTIVESFETTFAVSVQNAVRRAGGLLRSHLGGYAPEDVVGDVIARAWEEGLTASEIQALLNDGRGLHRRLSNAKNDLYSRETALKRGGKEPRVAYETLEPCLADESGDPQAVLESKEHAAFMQDILTRLLELVELSETQREIIELDRQGWSTSRIARALDLDKNTVYARRSEAHRKLAHAARRLAGLDQ